MSAVVGVTPNIRLIVLEKWAKSEKLPARAASVRSAPSDSALFALTSFLHATQVEIGTPICSLANVRIRERDKPECLAALEIEALSRFRSNISRTDLSLGSSCLVEN